MAEARVMENPVDWFDDGRDADLYWYTEMWRCQQEAGYLEAVPDPEIRANLRYMLDVPGGRLSKVSLLLITGDMVDGICPKKELERFAAGSASITLLVERSVRQDHRELLADLGNDPGETMFCVPITFKRGDVMHTFIHNLGDPND